MRECIGVSVVWLFFVMFFVVSYVVSYVISMISLLFLLAKAMTSICISHMTASLIAVLLWFIFSGCQSITHDRSQLHTSQPYDIQKAHDYAQRGLYREAIEAYQEMLVQDPNRPLLHRNIGIVYVHLGLYRRGFFHLKRAHVHYPQNFQTNYYLAEAYRVKKQWGQAVKHYNVCLTLRPAEIRAMRGLAWSYYNMANYSMALSALKKISADSQTDIIRARIHLAANNFNRALEAAYRAHERDEKVFAPFVISLLGDIYYKTNNLQRASEYYREALSLRPHLPSALLGEGKILYQKGEYRKASVLISRSLRVKTDQIEAYFYLALIYTHQAPKKALALYRRFLSLAQNSRTYAYLVDDVHKNISQLERTLNSHHVHP